MTFSPQVDSSFPRSLRTDQLVLQKNICRITLSITYRFRKVGRNFEFRRIFGSYRLLNICRITLSTSGRFRKVRRMSNNSYQLLVDFRKSTSKLQVPSNFWFVSTFESISKSQTELCRFRKIRQNFNVPSNFWFVKHLSNNYHQLLIDFDYRQSSVKFLISKHTIIVQLSLHNYRVSI